MADDDTYVDELVAKHKTTIDALVEMRKRFENPPPPNLTVAMIEERLETLAKLVGDPESAHAFEKATWEGTLTAIALGTENAPALAAAALRTEGVTFPRWFA